MPKISVIITAYKKVNLLNRALESLEKQTFKDFEVILINNGSPENIDEIFSVFAERKKINLKYFHIEKNAGIMGAYNFAMKHVQGEYLTFLDSDDEYFPDKLQTQYDVFLQHPEVDVVSCLYEIDKFGERYTPTRNQDFDKVLTPHQAIEAYTRNNWSLIPNTLMFKRKLLENTQFVFDEQFKVAGDIDMAISMLKIGNFYGISKPLFRYFINNDNTSGLTSKDKCLNSAKDQELLLQKHQDVYCLNSKIKAQQIKWIGVLYFLGGELKKGRILIWEAVTILPSKKNILTFFLSLFGHYVFSKVFLYKTRKAR